eukprot:Hpha_TRINITY_DN16058_c3_g2::TRINITY_DN16058_c3_g2_i4::g.120717::m.120717/K12837/U2AF2; splicing factor U2AF 65 kDa subunit
MRRSLFVGNLDPALGPEMLRNFFKLHGIHLRRKLYEAARRKLQDQMLDPNGVPAPDDSINPVSDVKITNEAGKPGFAFVELESEELATECLSLDGKDTPLPDGRITQLRVSRPKGYEGPPATAAGGGDAFGGGDLPPDALPNRLVIRGYPPNMKNGEQEVRALLEKMGPLELFDFMRDGQGKSLGRAVFAFSDPGVAPRCVAAYNGFDLGGGCRLVVERLSECTELTVSGASRKEADAEKKLMQNLVNLGMAIPQALATLADIFDSLRPPPGFALGAFPVRPTRFLCLINLFDDAELEDDDDYEYLYADIEQECEKYGRVVQLKIPREPPPVPIQPPKPAAPPPLIQGSRTARITAGPTVEEPQPAGTGAGALIVQPGRTPQEEKARRHEEWEDRCHEIDVDYEAAVQRWEKDMGDPVKNGVGKVFVEYCSIAEAQAAQLNLAGRQFGGRTVITTFVPEGWLYPPKAPETGAEDKAETMEDILKSLEGPKEVRAIEDKK